MKTIAVDLDGTIHPYTEGWLGVVPADEPPIEGAREFLSTLYRRGYRVVIFSTRCDTPEGMAATFDWLRRYGLYAYVDRVTCTKPKAAAYVDDRAVPVVVDRFGHVDWTSVLASVEALVVRTQPGEVAKS